ncbi:MAG: SNF2-related protein [Methylococcaceae bacterium]
MEILTLLNRQLKAVLFKSLTQIESNWWQSLVLDKLTFQQKLFAQNFPQNALEQLDLSALLRIVDQNWYDISNQYNFSKESRNWLKEAQSIRNRWAHAPADGLADDICYRDIDTIERLLESLGADADTLNLVGQHRKDLLQKIAVGDVPVQKTNSNISALSVFNPGEMVSLKAYPAKTGAVVGVLTGDLESRYQVFHDGAISTYYESQLEPAVSANNKVTVTPETFHAALSALQLRHPSINHLYSLFSSRINFVPYQFRPVLKLIQADRPRLLIADEVGVGKTIEAGLILKELQARSDIKSILIICPKPLVAENKWLEEMKRFDERFEHLDGKSLRYCINETHFNGVWPQKLSRVIVPYSLFDEGLLMGKEVGRKKQLGLLDLDPPPTFDLVIVDEAHAIRNTDTWAYRVARHFCDNAEAVLLLSATPIQLGNKDLYTLLHLLRPDVITSPQDFDYMAEPNPYLNAAIATARAAKTDWKKMTKNALDKALGTTWGRGVLIHDPRTQQAHDILTGDDESPETRLTITRHLEELYTFSPYINRTRRRDIGVFTTRKPETVTVEFTPEQAALHTNLIDLIARILAHRHGDKNLIFMLSMVRRQVSSCVFGLAPLLETMLNRHLSQLEISELDDDNAPEQFNETLAEFHADVNALIKQAKSIKGPDPKLDAFLKVIRDKQKLANNKLLVFSSFRHTLAYLIQKLSHESVRVGLIHGDIPDHERRDLRNRFSLAKEDPKALDVLLSSEVGCEGLDYQFCDGMVNYDLPWNPMRVEQRIGRIDRYGQKSETVVIYNFITPGTVDAEIYERCLLRIGIFRQALGGSEEILGKLTKEIREIAENFTLNPEEQAARFQQLADNEVRDIQEQARLEEEQSKLFGLTQPKHDEDMVKQAANFWLSPAMLANLISRYLQVQGASNLPASLGQKPVTTLQLGQEIRNKLLTDFKSYQYVGEAAQTWSRWLKGNDPYLALTFNQETAVERRDLIFITPTHPLTQQAALSVEPLSPLFCNLGVKSDKVPTGRYPYAIYRWRKLGIKEDFTFQPVCTHPELTGYMLELFEKAMPVNNDNLHISSEQENLLEKSHYQLWLDTRATHIEQVAQQASSRLASLKTTHAARITLLEEQRDNMTESRIRRMRVAQIDAAIRDYQVHADKLEQAPKQADLLAEVVAFGILTIERE